LVAVALAWQIDHRRIVDNYTEKLSQIESKARDNAALVSSYKRAAEFALDELKISKEREQIRAVATDKSIPPSITQPAQPRDQLLNFK
jgi:hypothetical protein